MSVILEAFLKGIFEKYVPEDWLTPIHLMRSSRQRQTETWTDHSFAIAEQVLLLSLSSRWSPLSLGRAKGGLKGGQVWSVTRLPFFLKVTSGLQKFPTTVGMWTLKVWGDKSNRKYKISQIEQGILEHHLTQDIKGNIILMLTQMWRYLWNRIWNSHAFLKQNITL